ncbi:hypothetical protein V8U11_22290 [Pseudomonas chlororaphis]|uniref:Uncharacterized protein n=1 Tax=Pseudomonas chlororaphis subsp. aurantiaca TaxID=86192 RepID=A0AAJ1E7P8_9PSED|nr:hypothetical protein [Pseudomonas chlororaphis]MBU4632706.1 hypothetical protein [Pseudomonas chlororaphis subsp. aurantiaca]
MDERLRLLCAQLAKMDSAQAADWLIGKYPIDSIDYGEAILLIPQRTWKRSDQRRLAQYYFAKLPFSGARGYESFASVMSIKLIIECVRAFLPMEESRVGLLLYYLVSALERAAKNDTDRKLIREFVSEVQ